MIPVKTIETKADQIIAGTPTAAQLAQLVAVGDYIDDVQVLTAATVATLPSAANNKGIIYYVTATQKYYFSDGTNWRSDFTSDYEAITKTAYGWGYNNSYRLGDGTLTQRPSPVTVIGGITNWKQVSTLDNHGLGVTHSGIAYAWGGNNNGQLGDNTTSGRSSPVTVVGGITNWSQVAAGSYFSVGLTATGILYAWGKNSYGQLGDNSTTSRSSPVTVVGGITTWNQISSGLSHTLALDSAGILYSWGEGASGGTGDNTTSNRSSPVSVVGGITTWSQISAGARHSLGVTLTGIAYSWGNNNRGQLGNNTTTNRSSPGTVVGGITNWSQISGSKEVFGFSLGCTTGGIAYAWGYNSNYQLGDNTNSSRLSPVTVAGGITNWTQLAAGQHHSMGITNSGTAYGWGWNRFGQLGTGTSVNGIASTPQIVLGEITNWSQITAGKEQTFALSVIAQYTKGFV